MLLSTTTAPEQSNSAESHREVMPERQQVALIYSLGGLVYGLATGEALPRIAAAKSIEDISIVPASDLNLSVSTALSDVV